MRYILVWSKSRDLFLFGPKEKISANDVNFIPRLFWPGQQPKTEQNRKSTPDRLFTNKIVPYAFSSRALYDRRRPDPDPVQRHHGPDGAPLGAGHVLLVGRAVVRIVASI